MSQDLRAELERFLESLEIQTSCIEHPAVFTVEEMMPHLQDVNLNELGKGLGVGGGNLRFADESLMLEKLKVGQGCATALALLFDKDLSVQFVLDQDLVEGPHPLVFFHPMTNSASLGMQPKDFLRFLEATGHKPILHKFP